MPKSFSANRPNIWFKQKFILTVFCVNFLLLQACSPASKPTPAAAPTPVASLPSPTATSVPVPVPVPLTKIPAPQSHDLILSDSERGVPREMATNWVYYRAKNAKELKISGAWDGWKQKTLMRRLSGNLWAFHVAGLQAPFGSYEFKFIVDGTWESGANRVLYLNENGQMEQPPKVVSQALIEHPHQIRLLFYQTPENPDAVKVSLEPSLGELKLRWRIPKVDHRVAGYRIDGSKVTFVLDPSAYGMNPSEVHSSSLAGSFNGWNANDPNTRMQRQDNGRWTVILDVDAVNRRSGSEFILFKFVVNGEWKNPPEAAPNAMLEPGTPHMNLQLPRAENVRPELLVQTAQPIDLRVPPLLTLTGLTAEPLRLRPSPGAVLDMLYSDKPMGVTLDRAKQQTHYRIFAPRATKVTLGFFAGPYYLTKSEKDVPPSKTFEMTYSSDGVWEHVEPGLNIGQYYAYQVAGALGNGEGFNPGAWIGDPYATAVALAEGNSIVMDLDAGAVKPQPKPRMAWEDMVIYETHVRDFTQDPSSGAPEALRGKYLGMLATEGSGAGLDHLKALGVNVIQLMPVQEFNNGFNGRYDWGYASCFFFAPESSYATRPLEGSQVEEFRELVDGLHQRGFAVFMDVVYNHIGGINVFNLIDRKYYFRLNPDFTNCSFSGCGNDVASERPMMRRLIKESVMFWVENYGIDGFRFDLCELIDERTLLEIEREIREKHPQVVLISEPWSFRGNHKAFLGQTSWLGWNDQFRESAKQFVVGKGGIANLKKVIRGSVETWTRHPLQSVNYMASHDDQALVDELSLNPGHDGRKLSDRDERVHKLAATLIFGSLGTPMLTEGQAFLRSKNGIRNTYNKGDKLNALRWQDRERPHAKEVLSYYQQMIAFRLSDAGRALRVKDAPSLDYTRFLENGEETFLGWILNATGERAGVPMVMVLANAGTSETTVKVDLPGGYWRQIGDGQQVNAAGVPGVAALRGGRSVTFIIPAQTALLYRSGI